MNGTYTKEKREDRTCRTQSMSAYEAMFGDCSVDTREAASQKYCITVHEVSAKRRARSGGRTALWHILQDNREALRQIGITGKAVLRVLAAIVSVVAVIGITGGIESGALSIARGVLYAGGLGILEIICLR